MSNFENRLLYLSAALLWGFVIIKAASCPITWDESWTYFHYTQRWSDLLTLDYANNHILNSFLIRLSLLITGTHSEFVIRLPNVLAAGAYLAANLSALPTIRYRKTFFIIGIGFPFLFDYFALARGYGLAAGLIQTGLVIAFFRPIGKWSFVLFGLCFAAASLSSFPLAIASLVFCAFFIIIRITKQQFSLIHSCEKTVFWVVTTGLIITAIIALYCLRQVSLSAVGVFGSYDNVYVAVFRNIIYQNFGILAAIWLTPIILVAFVLFFISQIPHLSIRTILIIGTGVVAMGSICIISYLLHKPFPSARVLIPWYPLWTLGFLSLMEDIPLNSPFFTLPRIRIASSIVCGLIVISFIHRINFHTYQDWPTEDNVPSELAHAISEPKHCLTSNISQQHNYYLSRWFGPTASKQFPRCK